MKAVFRNGPDFAEVAEALHVPTDHVLAALPTQEQNAYTILYSKEFPPDLDVMRDSPEVFGARLTRGPDGILVLVGEKLLPGAWAELRRHMEQG